MTPLHTDEPESGQQRSAGGGLDYEPVSALIPYMHTVRQHWRLIVAVAVISMLTCAAFLTTRPSTYEAQAQVLVTPLTPGDQSFVGLPIVRTAPGDPTRVVETVAGVIDSPDVAREAAASVSAGVSAADIGRTVVVEVEEGSNVVNVTAEADNPELAAEVASAYAQAALDVRQKTLQPLVAAAITKVEGQLETIDDPTGTSAEALRTRLRALTSLSDGADPTLSVSEFASTPTSPLNQPAWLLIALAGVAGAIIGIGATGVYRLLTQRLIEDEESLLLELPLPIFARVPTTTRREKGSGWRVPQEARSAYRLLRAQLQVRGQETSEDSQSQIGPTGVVAIVGATAGVGTADATIGLATAISQAGSEAIMIDGASWRGGFADQLGERPSGSNGSGPADGFAPVLGVPGVLVATASTGETGGAMLGGLVEDAEGLADCVIADVGPADRVTDGLTVIRAADHIVLVVRLGHTRSAGLQSAVQLLGEEIADDRIGYLILDAA